MSTAEPCERVWGCALSAVQWPPHPASSFRSPPASPQGRGKETSYLKLASTMSGASLPAWKLEPVSRFETVTTAGLNSEASIL